MDEMIDIRLTKEELSLLNYALGLAAGEKLHGEEPGLFWHFHRLANRVNENNPDWTPFEIAEEEKE